WSTCRKLDNVVYRVAAGTIIAKRLFASEDKDLPSSPNATLYRPSGSPAECLSEIAAGVLQVHLALGLFGTVGLPRMSIEKYAAMGPQRAGAHSCRRLLT